MKVFNILACIVDMDTEVTIHGLHAQSEAQAREIVALYFPRMEVIRVEEVSSE